MDPVQTFLEALQNYASNLTRNFAISIPANPEDQLKGPVQKVLVAEGEAREALLQLLYLACVGRLLQASDQGKVMPLVGIVTPPLYSTAPKARTILANQRYMA